MSEQEHVVNKEGELTLNKVDNAISHMDGEKKEEILSNFESFKKYLGEKIQLGQSLGLSEELLAKTAEKVAGYLAENEEPRNREEKLLQELWKVGDQDQRHKLAHLLVRLAQSAN
ncbi:hypothetical protein J2Z69_002927 [Paenibacillus shirakamiensis]|uniref:DUF3243 domain-containing protein n=1 Tax=Paenibacillus shirakamiensis TaxID=1265935 RepID=A0ABS4JLB3_9BACL|nr:DUF3243 family protein [Paenibacillus shirakamiensis]MBP2001871.1 hypothetical protein [Paenibacillus shirakamiensis]